MALVVYGIVNCDSVRKTRQYLDKHDTAYQFVDLRNPPPTVETLIRWYETFGDKLMNKYSATYRAHKEEAAAASLVGASAVAKLLHQYPTMIKRPLIEEDGRAVLLGWSEMGLEALIKDD